MQIKRWKYQPDLQVRVALLSSFSDNLALFIKAKPQKAGRAHMKKNVFKVTIDITPVAWNFHKNIFLWHPAHPSDGKVLYGIMTL